MNCSVLPRVMTGLVGVTLIDSSVGEVTVRIVEPEMLPDVAVIVVMPAATNEICPIVAGELLLPLKLLIVAAARFDEFHVTDAVRS